MSNTKNRVIGGILFFFFILMTYILEDGTVSALFQLSPALIVLGSTSGLALMHYKKGMSKNELLKSVKKYFIYTGYLAFLLGCITILRLYPDNLTNSQLFRSFSSCILPILYGYLLGVLVDTFIYEE